ncbi:CRAL-TRIO domain-containing protein [Xylogone sp. PMI_703]|nr:CRAL-TRIO domain-containing protein [Xylogone sp. PMI_703]
MSTESENKATEAVVAAPPVEEAQVAAPNTTVAESKESEAAPATVEESKPEAPSKDIISESKPASEKGSKKDGVAKPLDQLFAELPSIIKEAGYSEMWGVELIDQSHVPTTIVLEKFLRANPNDVTKAKSQLIEALKWRKQLQPHKLLDETEFDGSKFGELGYVTIYTKPDGVKEIITWNIYGTVKDKKATFGNVEEFIKWRSALMELSVRELDLPNAKEKIPEGGIDPYRMIQVHDYQNVSFLRMDPTVKAASKETIRVMSIAYPELLKEKFFVNVPVVMGWVFAALKVFLSAETVKKFHPLSYGSSLAGELRGIGEQLPKAYGGKGKDIKDGGFTVKYSSSETAVAAVPAPAASEPVATEKPADPAIEATEPTPATVQTTEPTPAEPATVTGAVTSVAPASEPAVEPAAEKAAAPEPSSEPSASAEPPAAAESATPSEPPATTSEPKADEESEIAK